MSSRSLVTRGRRAARRADKAIAVTTTQAVTAGGSLVLQIIAARELGLAGYGAFALCLSLLTTATALYTGYVGDALTVMDRQDRVIRQALLSSAIIGLLGCFVVASGVVPLLHLGDWQLGVVYGTMLVLWLVEETGRRLLMSRLEFWSLVCNDATYVGATLAALAVIVVAGIGLSLMTILVAMLIGALASIVLALFQLPPVEFRPVRPSLAGGAVVARFAVWRSLQSTLKPTQLLAARVLLLQFVSLAAVGAVESGRLVVAPMQTVLNGAASLLLSTGASRDREGKAADPRSNDRVSAALAAITVVGGVLAAVLSDPLGRLMAGRPVAHLLVLGWAAYMAAWAASLSFTAELTVRRLSWPVFCARLVETVVGLLLVAGSLALGARVELVPWLLSLPAIVNIFYIRGLAVRSRTATGAHSPEHAMRDASITLSVADDPSVA